MLHPSYTDLMAVVNSEVEEGEQPVVQSRYSIVIAAAKRARQIIAGSEPLVDGRGKSRFPLLSRNFIRERLKSSVLMKRMKMMKRFWRCPMMSLMYLSKRMKMIFLKRKYASRC